MTTVEQTITRVRRRRLLAAAMHRGAAGLSAGLGAGILAVVTLRLAGWPGPAAVLGLLATLGLLVGVATAWTAAPPRRRIATEVDGLFNLRDRLGSVLALDAGNAGGADPAFAAYVRADAQAQLRRVSTRLAGPVGPTRVWAAAATLAAVGTAVVLWMPQRERSSAPDENLAAGPTLTPADQRLATEIDSALQTIEELPEQDAVQEDVAALRELARQLEGGADGETAPAPLETRRAESAARIAEVAETLARDAEEDLARADELTRRFRGLPANERTTDGAALREALERGDFGDAAEQLDQLVREEPELQPDRRESLGEDLRGLARAVETAGESSESARTQRADQLEQALRDQGLTQEEAEQLLEQDAEALESALREIGADPELSRRLAEDIDAHRQRGEAEDQVREDSEAIAESIEQTADMLTEPPGESSPAETPAGEPGDPGETPPGEPGVSGKTPPADTPPTESAAPPSDESPSADSPSTEPPRETSSAEPRDGSRTGDTTEPQPADTPDESRPPQPGHGDEQPQQQEQQPGARESTDPARQPDEQRQQAEESTQKTGEGQPKQSDQQEQQQRQEQQQEQEQQQQQSPAESGEEKPRRGASRVLREMAKRIAQAAEKSQRSEKLAEKARKMIEGMDPEQRRKLAEQAKKLFENMDEQQMKKLAEQARQMLENMTPEQREQLQKTLEQTPPEQREAMRKQMEEALGETPPEQQQAMEDRMRKAFEQMPPGQREQMQEMLEQMTPQQQRDLARGLAGRPEGRGGQADAPGPSAGDATPGTATRLGAETEDLDLAGDETVERVIARWTDPDAEPAEPGAASERTARGRVQSARDVAERAVNDSALPRRYHRSVRRYFERLPNTVEQAVEKKRRDDTDEGG